MNIHVLIIRVEILELKFIVLCYVRGQQFLIVINNVCALQYLVKSPNGKYRNLFHNGMWFGQTSLNRLRNE